jgi:hypothetical protein
MARWWKRDRGRRPPSSADPVAAAVAELEGRLLRRYADTPTSLEDLLRWVEVSESDDLDGFDTVAVLSDEIHAYCDPYDDGLEQALADQPGIEDVLAEDRDVVYLRTSLALPDVTAAVLRAVVEINRSPRAPAPTAVLSDELVEQLAAAVRPVLEDAGFVARDASASARYFHREADGGLVQSVMVAAGLGETADGTLREGRLWVHAGTHVPEMAHRVLRSPERIAPADCTVSIQHWPDPTVEALREALTGQVLPVLDATRRRSVLAAWVSEDPTRVSVPIDRPRFARVFAEWGMLDEASLVLAHIDQAWPSLRDHPEVVQARRLISEGSAG